MPDVVEREAVARSEPVAGQELTDAQWEHIRPVMPGGKGVGRPRADDRQVLNGILHVVRNGWRWRDAPPQYASRATRHRRFLDWQEHGAWESIWTAFLATLDPQERQRCMEAYRRSAAGRPRLK
ncbi:MAG: transposase [Dehalococcoidia bacterium]|nr:transposase [Dehalococcoidia bacterium]